jgi:hypothetical protein
LTALQHAIKDKPEVTIELEFIELQNAGFAVTAPGLGDTVPTIYEPLSVDLDLRILEIEDYPESTKSPKVALSNVRQTFADVNSVGPRRYSTRYGTKIAERFATTFIPRRSRRRPRRSTIR